MKIKSKLIHLLGGITKDELKGELKAKESSQNELYNRGVFVGKSEAFVSLKHHTDSIFGVDADSWCKSVYEFIANNIKDIQENTKAEPRNNNV